MTTRFLRLISLMAGLLGAAVASAQPFPNKPVRVIVPLPSGTGPDTVMRLVGEKLAREWGQAVVVDNRPGANGWIAVEAAKKSPADGYTLGMISNEQAALQPHIYKQMPFDIEKDFEPVAPIYSTHFFVVVPVNSPWQNIGDLFAAAKTRDGKLAYGSWGIGSVGHVAAAMLEHAGNAPMTHIPFKDLVQLYGAVVNADIAWAMGSAATTGPLFRANKVKYLALAAPRRLATFGAVPTVTEAGGPPDFEARAIIGLFAPRGVPQAIIERIERDVAKALGESDVNGKLVAVGFEPFIGDGKSLAQAFAADSQRFARVARQAKISID